MRLKKNGCKNGGQMVTVFYFTDAKGVEKRHSYIQN